MPRCCHKPRNGFRKAFQHARVVTLRCFLLCLEFRPRNDFNIFKQRRIPCLGCMGKGSWIFKIRFLQPIGTWKTQRMTQNNTKQTIPYPLHVRRDAMLAALQSACKQLCSCWYTAMTTSHTWDLTNTISHVWQQKIERADMAFRLYSNTLGNEFLETQLFEQEFNWF